MIAIIIGLLIGFYITQVTITLISLYYNEYETKKEFLIDLIPILAILKKVHVNFMTILKDLIETYKRLE